MKIGFALALIIVWLAGVDVGLVIGSSTLDLMVIVGAIILNCCAFAAVTSVRLTDGNK